MNWMRLYYEARTDKKLQVLSDKQFRVWFNLMVFSAEQPTRGVITYDDLFPLSVEVARGDIALLETTIELLVRLRIIATSSGEITFINFNRRQYSKPSDAPDRVAERVEKHRERQRNADVTRGNADVTTTDTDTELSSNELNNPPISPPDEKPKRKHRLPADWQLSDEQRSRLLEAGYLLHEIDSEVPKFQRHHWHKGDTGLNWNLAFTNWMATSRQFGRPPAPVVMMNGMAMPPEISKLPWNHHERLKWENDHRPGQSA